MATKLPGPIPLDNLSVEHKKLHQPSLKEAAEVLQQGLLKHFKEVEVSVEQCPDLTADPFFLASEGICGKPRLLDIGGVPNLVPSVKKEKLYDLMNVPVLTDMKGEPQLIIGAGAAPWTFLERNAEMMPNLLIHPDGKERNQQTHISRTHDGDGSYEQIKLPQTETKLSLLGNLFLSQGKSGPVLKVRCKRRIGKDNFVTAMRTVLAEKYRGQAVGMGGPFLLKNGKGKYHVMPAFSECPLNTDEDVENWLKFYQMKAPIVNLSFFISEDPGLDLRVEHTHGFSRHGDAGHYHYDTTPDEVEYLGYFNIAEYCYRVDRPKETHMIGRD